VVSPLPTIITLHQAKMAAGITHAGNDEDLLLRLEIATEWVLDYVNNRLEDSEAWTETVVGWTEDTAPRVVKGAILHTFVYLARFRGDDPEKDLPVMDNGLPGIARHMLDRWRDPTVA
jgi:hypothetical protein